MEQYNLNADSRAKFQNCPRCGEHGFEKLKTHSHCVNCNYYDVQDGYSYINQTLRCDQILNEISTTNFSSSIKILRDQKSELANHGKQKTEVESEFNPSAA